MNLADLIEREYGSIETEHRLDAEGSTVGTTAVVIAKNSPRRLALTIINLAATAVYVKPHPTVSATSGIRLAPSGGSMSLNWRDDLHLVGYEWSAIGDAAGSNVLVMELLSRA